MFFSVLRQIFFVWLGDLVIICGVLRCIAVFCGVLWCFVVFCGVLRCFAAFSGVFRRFPECWGYVSVVGPNIWGGSNPCPLFWLVVKIIVPNWGGSGPLSPLKTCFLVSSGGGKILAIWQDFGTLANFSKYFAPPCYHSKILSAPKNCL